MNDKDDVEVRDWTKKSLINNFQTKFPLYITRKWPEIKSKYTDNKTHQWGTKNKKKLQFTWYIIRFRLEIVDRTTGNSLLISSAFTL